MPNRFQKKSPLHPNEWSLYEVEPVDRLPVAEPDYAMGEAVRVPIVGARHHGITPYDLRKGGFPFIAGEPGNPYDSTALLVGQALPDGTAIPVGHVPKTHKWIFAAIHPETWKDPEFTVIYDGGWYFDVVVPAEWLKGFYAYNQPGTDPTDRGGNTVVVERNWWLAGYLASRNYDALLR